MRIVVDLQGAQGSNRNRGIGRYSLQFAKAIVRNAKRHEIFIILNSKFADTIEKIRSEFEGILPQDHILSWDLHCPVAWLDHANNARREAAERIRETFLSSLKPDWVIVSSLFEGLSDDVVTSVGLQTDLPTAVILYDLIPLIYSDRYLKANPVIEQWYQEKILYLKRSNLLFSISNSAGQEAINYINFNPDFVVPIGTDCETHFKPAQISEELQKEIFSSYHIKKPFVMYTGGIDFRKNIEGLISAYALLPTSIRSKHQLVIVCDIQAPEKNRLLRLANDVGLLEDDLIFTGFVSDKDLYGLYNLCKLFVFPSWHEGFGLPVLEAMRCGKAVLAANSSSLPEVVGRDDALFDPFNANEMSALIERVLSNDSFRHALEKHALEQSQQFSWDKTAKVTLDALEEKYKKTYFNKVDKSNRRSRLAYISPLPPDKSGIADYSAELLPLLNHWYDVDIIVPHPNFLDHSLFRSYAIYSIEEFRKNAADYDRVLYHFGNSTFHEHMFSLLQDVPGVVVLHDFFLSGIHADGEIGGRTPYAWSQALMKSHGYKALFERYTSSNVSEVIWNYPANLSVLQDSLGVIVHSEFSRSLAKKWYGEDVGLEWAIIPHLREPPSITNRDILRRNLGYSSDDVILCSFGLLGATKLNDRLLNAWLVSPLVHDPKAHLIFVGENSNDDYGLNLLQRIRDANVAERIKITGWADTDTYRQYLAVADVAVQLRTLSRGETSGTVLDSMNHGIATIVNSHGSIYDINPAAVWMLPDAFSDEQLIEALTTLSINQKMRDDIGQCASETIRTNHAPGRCAEEYYNSIERFYQYAERGLYGLLHKLPHQKLCDMERLQLAASLSQNFPPTPRHRQLLVDVSELVMSDAKSGIQRVVRSILQQWLKHPPHGFLVEPVYAATSQSGYRYARLWTSGFLGIPDKWAEDIPVEAWAGDVFIGLDFQPQVQVAQRDFYQHLRRQGVETKFVVYDLLCIQTPQFFAKGANEGFENWLHVVAESDGAICISQSVADDLTKWFNGYKQESRRPFKIDWFHLGADVDESLPTNGIPPTAAQIRSQLAARPSFLMVGTVEPRKGHVQVLDAFDLLWTDGARLNLVIVGKKGWLVDALITRIRCHPELNKRLFWLDGISDEFLTQVYSASTCLIAASYGEGFGLPLVEAAKHKIPIIARDIPVFREVAGKHAYYFKADYASELTHIILSWLDLYHANNYPKSECIPWLTWKESSRNLLAKLGILFNKNIEIE